MISAAAGDSDSDVALLKVTGLPARIRAADISAAAALAPAIEAFDMKARFHGLP